MDALRRIGRDLARRQHVDAYVVAAAAILLATLSLFGDLVSTNVRWSVALAALGLLVYRITLPEGHGDIDGVLLSRSAFDDVTFASRLRTARNVWIFAPSAANLLTASTADELRRTVLARADGAVRVAVLDPSAKAAVDLAARQLDDAVDFPMQKLHDALPTTVSRLASMSGWDVPGNLDVRYAAYSPGFSLVAVDPYEKHGVLIVEFHGFHNESTGSRMHIEIHRRDTEHWYEYWTDQFETLWSASRPPTEGPAD